MAESACHCTRRFILRGCALVSDGVDAPCLRQSTLGTRAGASKAVDHMNANIHLSAGPLVSLLAGILILVMPKLLNYIVAIYLIVIGLIGLFGVGALHMT